jgi:hypothetical protein
MAQTTLLLTTRERGSCKRTQPGNDDPKAQVQDYFSRPAESYVASFSHKAGSDLERLIERGSWPPRSSRLPKLSRGSLIEERHG